MPSRATFDFSQRVPPHTLPEMMDGDCSYEEFRDCLRSLEQVNRWLLGYRPTLAWLKHLESTPHRPLHIVDVGSGSGDLLREIAHSSQKRGVAVDLTGIDLNPYAARAAAESTPHKIKITWITGDAFAFHSSKPVDIILCSLMAHHLEDEEVIRLVRWMEATAQVGWFINDLERSQGAARIFTWLAAIAGWHRFVAHDGPVSFRRAFRKEDWTQLLTVASLPLDAVTIERWRPGRLCVGRWK